MLINSQHPMRLLSSPSCSSIYGPSFSARRYPSTQKPTGNLQLCGSNPFGLIGACILLVTKFFFFFFFNGRHAVREREAETQAEGEAGSMHREPDVGFDPESPGSRPGPKAGAKLLRHPGIPLTSFILYLHDFTVQPLKSCRITFNGHIKKLKISGKHCMLMAQICLQIGFL